VVFEDVGGDADEVDGLAQGQPLGQVVGGDAEGLGGEADRLTALAEPGDEVRHPGLRHEQHARPLISGQPSEPGLVAVHLAETDRRELAGGQLDAAQGGCREGARRHVRQHGNRSKTPVVA
jgi:hypothetical protein